MNHGPVVLMKPRSQIPAMAVMNYLSIVRSIMYFVCTYVSTVFTDSYYNMIIHHIKDDIYIYISYSPLRHKLEFYVMFVDLTLHT